MSMAKLPIIKFFFSFQGDKSSFFVRNHYLPKRKRLSVTVLSNIPFPKMERIRRNDDPDGMINHKRLNNLTYENYNGGG